jgi:hypothetical protein
MNVPDSVWFSLGLKDYCQGGFGKQQIKSHGMAVSDTPWNGGLFYLAMVWFDAM